MKKLLLSFSSIGLLAIPSLVVACGNDEQTYSTIEVEFKEGITHTGKISKMVHRTRYSEIEVQNNQYISFGEAYFRFQIGPHLININYAYEIKTSLEWENPVISYTGQIQTDIAKAFYWYETKLTKSTEPKQWINLSKLTYDTHRYETNFSAIITNGEFIYDQYTYSNQEGDN